MLQEIMKFISCLKVLYVEEKSSIIISPFISFFFFSFCFSCYVSDSDWAMARDLWLGWWHFGSKPNPKTTSSFRPASLFSLPCCRFIQQMPREETIHWARKQLAMGRRIGTRNESALTREVNAVFNFVKNARVWDPILPFLRNRFSRL